MRDKKNILFMANWINNDKNNMRINNAILVSDLLKILTLVDFMGLQINKIIIIFD